MFKKNEHDTSNVKKNKKKKRMDDVMIDEHEFWPIYSSNLILMCGVSQAKNYSHRTYPFFWTVING